MRWNVSAASRSWAGSRSSRPWQCRAAAVVAGRACPVGVGGARARRGRGRGRVAHGQGEADHVEQPHPTVYGQLGKLPGSVRVEGGQQAGQCLGGPAVAFGRQRPGQQQELGIDTPVAVGKLQVFDATQLLRLPPPGRRGGPRSGRASRGYTADLRR